MQNIHLCNFHKKFKNRTTTSSMMPNSPLLVAIQSSIFFTCNVVKYTNNHFCDFVTLQLQMKLLRHFWTVLVAAWLKFTFLSIICNLHGL